MSDDDLLGMLLRERPAPVPASDLASYWQAAAAYRARFSTPIDRAIAGGAVSDRLGFAFASGYQAALVALIPGLSADGTASFCVTEEGGNRPRHILSRLEGEGAVRLLTGSKRWSTMAPLATTLVVIAKASTRDDGRPVLVAVKVPVSAQGLTVTEMPAPPFVPEVTHAELRFTGVAVDEAEVLPGDAYDEYVKPFRTVEDLHVQAGVLGYLSGVAFRLGFPDEVRECLVALVVTARGLARLDPRRAETHVALAGFLAQIGSLLSEVEKSWSLAGDSERERWYRDVALVGVAQRARIERRARAFQSIEGDRAS